MTGHYRKKSLFFRDTRDNQEHDAKNRLSIPGPSPEELLAEVLSLKRKLTLGIYGYKSTLTCGTWTAAGPDRGLGGVNAETGFGMKFCI